MSGSPTPGDFYVAQGGLDINPGTVDKPFATLGRARDAVRERIAGGLKGDVTVLIRSGTYELSETLALGPDDSGTDEHAVTYAAFPGEQVVISGGRRISGWKVRKDGGGEIEVFNCSAGLREVFAITQLDTLFCVRRANEDR